MSVLVNANRVHLEAEHAHTALPTGHQPPFFVWTELDGLDVVVRYVLGQDLSLQDAPAGYQSRWSAAAEHVEQGKFSKQECMQLLTQVTNFGSCLQVN